MSKAPSIALWLFYAMKYAWFPAHGPIAPRRDINVPESIYALRYR